jgi:hypothetical protein
MSGVAESGALFVEHRAAWVLDNERAAVAVYQGIDSFSLGSRSTDGIARRAAATRTTWRLISVARCDERRRRVFM